MKKSSYLFAFVVLLCTVFLSCQKSPAPSTPVVPSAKLPVVTTDSVTNITYNSADVYTNITSDGGSSITARGICWSTIANPTTSDKKTLDGTGTGVYPSNITGLNEATSYYVRSYATNSIGTAYSAQTSFTTGNIPNILTQWMLSNLDVVTYKNGDSIPKVTDATAWKNLTTGAWCYYNNDSTNGALYGKLYNWYAVNDPRGLAPNGWHIPTKQEWSNVIIYLGGDMVAGGKLKTMDLWLTPNTGATNESGFNGRPAGYRTQSGDFTFLGQFTSWWTAKEHDSTTAVERSLGYNYPDSYMYFYDKHYGMSVRCVKN
jgi:uncharacterized protein (TIGR02145 family)